MITEKGNLPMYFGMNTLAKFGDMTGKNMNQVLAAVGDMSKMKMSELLVFIYCGFVEGARKEKVDCVIESVEMVGDMIDTDATIIQKSMEVYRNQSTPDNVEKNDSKKK